MRLATRKMLDRYFSGFGILSIALMVASLLVVLLPVFIRGWGAFYFVATTEHRRMMLDRFDRGKRTLLEAEFSAVAAARKPVYDMCRDFETFLESQEKQPLHLYKPAYKEFRKHLSALLGQVPGEPRRMLMRDQYGQTRWDRANIVCKSVLFRETWDYSDPSRIGKKILVPRVREFRGTPLEPAFGYIETNLAGMLRPRRTFYWQFLVDESFDSHFFGGIWPELLGTIYLTAGAVLFAVPVGVIAAIYLAEYARETALVAFLRTCISTLAGVPSIVFGLFGLAFFINTLGVSDSKSVLAGSMTLALMILPTIIRASEEAVRAVPATYKEAALSLGASRWHTVATVILPASLPGILTGTIISMGRAAGETAPIIFTAAVTIGKPLRLQEAFTQPTPALPWNIYNLATEHAAVDAIRHVQFGMVATLVLIVLLLNVAAIVLRARISRKLRA